RKHLRSQIGTILNPSAQQAIYRYDSARVEGQQRGVRGEVEPLLEVVPWPVESTRRCCQHKLLGVDGVLSGIRIPREAATSRAGRSAIARYDASRGRTESDVNASPQSG